MRKKIIRYILPVLATALAVTVALVMIKSRKAPKRITPESLGPMVETMLVRLGDRPVTVTGTGTVVARRQVEIIPQVNGVVTKMAPRLVPGAFFDQGDFLVKIEETDYSQALEQARADLAKAELDLALVEGQAAIARREWRMLRDEKEEEPVPLVVYEPQLASAKATVASARAKVRLAEVNLERTRITAPFNCFVRTKEVDLGQYLRSGTMILEVVGTDRVEVVVPFAQDDLAWLHVPRRQNGQGSEALVTMQVGDEELRWQGFVSRVMGEVDNRTRMVNVVIVIDDPYGLQRRNGPGQELAVGSFVHVQVAGRHVKQAARIPRSALKMDDQVWLVTSDNTLALRPVEVKRKEKDMVLITGGLAEGERLMLTSVNGAAEGMVVRLRQGDDTP